MKKFVLLFLLALILLSSGCINQADKAGNPVLSNRNNDYSTSVEKVEIFHFHRHRQCYSCITLGNYAEETVNTYFAEELESGKIIFGHVNVELSENAETAEKYGATGSSLFIGVYDENGFHAEEDTKVWYKLNNKEDFMGYLKGVIEEKLRRE
jgi:hypothetical protein